MTKTPIKMLCIQMAEPIYLKLDKFSKKTKIPKRVLVEKAMSLALKDKAYKELLVK